MKPPGYVSAVAVVLAIVLGICGCKDAVEQGAKQVEAQQAYIERSIDSEAELLLKQLATGASAFYQNEHASSDGMTVTTFIFPSSPGEVCTASSESEKIEPGATDWNAEPWRTLNFTIANPHYFQYCYQSSADQKRFVAWAIGRDKAFCLEGSATGPEPTISAPRPVPEGDPGCRP